MNAIGTIGIICFGLCYMMFLLALLKGEAEPKKKTERRKK